MKGSKVANEGLQHLYFSLGVSAGGISTCVLTSSLCLFLPSSGPFDQLASFLALSTGCWFLSAHYYTSVQAPHSLMPMAHSFIHHVLPREGLSRL